ncbi:sulfate ABC transporter permease subunit CysT [Rugosimonospora africana]|uniref:Sulfate transport system permease protein CysT n=1 Tax=Rugosimonospora africana TaxID=556532 RepID=A0A8J3R0G4_9ACTN|nr:sulfate ABC transporter permease subunit CysT [Rugosimonospora africana]GIH17961.1 sulfate ABC transporter permease subunit CysT [Rugosimonospora africana]
MTTDVHAPPAALDEVPAGGAGPRRRPRAKTGLRLGGASGTTLGVVVLWMSLLVLIPLAAVLGKAFDGGWSAFADAITQPATAAALRLTITLSVAVAVINAVMGTIVAWVLVRGRFPGAGIFEMVIDIPFALPTIVAGLVMLALYGGDSPIGVSLVGTRTGLLVTLLFVTLPFTVRTVQPVLLNLDREAEEAAASLGASAPVIFRRIALPQLMPAIISGAVLSFARAIGEYGSVVLISSNLPFKTEIASSVIYGKLQDADNAAVSTQQAAAIATVLLAASAVVLVLIDVLQRRVARRG